MSTEKKGIQESESEVNNDISPVERSLLDESIENTMSVDNENLNRSVLDNTDEDGDLLNAATEENDFTGENLDIPGADLDDENE
ncbi:MAG TPA: hypothetical protein VLR49_14725, partial [Ferruginibacter sp.]|nr:hypothetical protein [Ferruginibacter sp.]